MCLEPTIPIFGNKISNLLASELQTIDFIGFSLDIKSNVRDILATCAVSIGI